MSLEHLSATHDSAWFAEACERARRGMKLLDERGPENWLSRININALDMGNATRDILGQLYGSYHRGMCALFGDEWAERKPEIDPETGKAYLAFGFATAMGMTRFVLTDAWKKELFSR